MESALLPFSLSGDRFDQSTFFGRCRHNFMITSPSNLMSTDAQIHAALSLLKAFQEGKLPDNITDEMLWDARAIKEGSTRGETGEIIPMPFRISAFAPVNVPICFLMLQGHTLGAKLLGQWANQTYNVGVNYCNRGEGEPLEMSQLAASYTLAVVSSIGVVYLGQKLIPKNASGALASIVPFTAVSGAGVLNLLLTRSSELQDGLAIYDDAEKYLGMSKLAAQDALFKCSMARVLWTAPCLLLPGICMAAIERTKIIEKAGKRSTSVRLGFQLALQALFLRYAVPPAMSVWSQKAELPASSLEPEFGGSQDPGKKLFFNKGL